MRLMTIIIPLFLILTFNRADGLNKVATSRTTADRVRSFGYHSETHTLVTHDGYVLSLFRISKSRQAHARPRPVVLMMHGLTGSSDCWVINGPSNALAFNLVDSGYDVWLGNSRGNPYSSRHLSLTTRDRAFWRFSWDKMAAIDLPATIDYILKVARQPSLHYVGHSQGTAIMMALLTIQPKYNKRLRSSHMLAPVAYMTHARSVLVEYLEPLLGTYTLLDPIFGDKAFFQHPILKKLFGIYKCRSPHAPPDLCAFFLSIASGFSAHIPNSLLPEIYNTHPATCSTHQFIHFVQLHVSGHFRPYDHGVQGNLQRYNRTTPPDYKLANINPRFPLNLYYSDYDVLSSKLDVERLARALGNRSVKHFIKLKQFAHFDFLWASNVKDVINRGILRNMQKVEILLQRPRQQRTY